MGTSDVLKVVKTSGVTINHKMHELFHRIFCIYLTKLLQEVDIPLSTSNGNRTEWSTIQGVIGQVFSNWKL